MFQPGLSRRKFVVITLCALLVSQSAAQTFPPQVTVAPGADNRPTLSRPLPPFKDLPNLDALINEGKATTRTAPRKPAPKPSTICGFRDKACQRLKEKKEPKKISLVAPSGNEAQRQTERATAQPGGLLSRLSSKLRGLFSGNSLGSLLTPPVAAHSFVPATTASTALFTPPNFPTLEQAKLDARYRVGGAAEDLFSGNIHWSVPLVSLPGRAGLDLNLQLHYNSLVWIRNNSWIRFDYDYYPTLTPGFRTGFPELAGPYTLNGFETYIVTLPTGRRVEMRRLTTNKYEAIDSSYLYLEHNPTAQTMTLSSTDGTRFLYTLAPDDGWWHCAQILDSNGNYISVAYKSIGDPSWPLVVIDKIIDTLGREIVFSYDDNLHLQDITQTRNGQTFTWAHFDYDNRTINTNFGGLAVDGPANNTQIPAISRVITADGARHTFDYNSWGQAEDFYLYGEADNQRAITDYSYPGTGTAQNDCPRPTARADRVWGWPGQTYDPNTGFGSVTTTFAYDAANETWGEAVTPDGVKHKQLFHTTSDKRGLASGTETWYGGQKKKWTTATWVSESGVYPVRPYVIETNIYDDANGDGTADKRRRVAIDYTAIGTVKLPALVTEYDTNATTVLRSTQTSYVTNTNYTSRRLIGLPQWQYLYDGSSTLQAKTEYLYDTVALQNITGAISNHDATFNTGFTYRGNLTKVRRYNTPTTPDDGIADNSYTETTTGYDINGSVAYTEDAIGATHRTTYSYTDAYLDPPSSTYTPPAPTYAYPTTVTDPDSYSSTVKYAYDRGLAVQATNPKGATTNYAYDGRWRLERATSAVNGAYTRNVYDFGHNWVQTWTTVNTTAEETAVLHLLDGASRERMTVNEHPGSTGGLSASYQVYDIMGRVRETSNQTEIDSQSWAPAGDDAVTLYAYSQQTYDWNSRPLETTLADGSKRKAEYTGCGCAGGVATTYTDEAGRRTKVYDDVLGRAYQSEVLNWTGSAPYSTTITTYNVRNQVTEVRKYAGTNGTNQAATASYDGYGRLWKRRAPSESADSVLNYRNDDTLQSVIDARGSSATYGYNNRDLVTSVTYSASSGVKPSANVSFQYDEVGNRTQMNDGVGYITYNYNTLSRLTSETRHFNDITARSFTLGYDYNLVGQLKSLTDPWNYTINYNYDKAGRIGSVTGSAFPLDDVNGQPYAYQTNYLTGFGYRAWGAPKQYTYNNSSPRGAEMLFNSRMQLTRFNIQNEIGAEYRYDELDTNGDLAKKNDGRLKFVHYLNTGAFDQSFTYDHASRITNAESGSRARGDFSTTYGDGPFKQAYGYDVFGNMTSRSGKHWWQTNGKTHTATYTSNTAPTFIEDSVTKARTHDAAGRILTEQVVVSAQWNEWMEFKYDVAGQQAETHWRYTDPQLDKHAINFYDGDGQLAVAAESDPVPTTGGSFYVRSSALGGQPITVLSRTAAPAGQFSHTTNVWFGGSVVAQQKGSWLSSSTEVNQVVFLYSDPHNLYSRQSNTFQPLTRDPLGMTSELPDPYRNLNNYYNNYYRQHAQLMSSTQGAGRDSTNPQVYGSGCQGVVDGAPVSCNTVLNQLNSGLIDPESIKLYGPSNILVGKGWIIWRGLVSDGESVSDSLAGVYVGSFESSSAPLVSTPTGEQQAQPCDVVIPTNKDELAAWQTLMGESERVQTALTDQEKKNPGIGPIGGYAPDQYGQQAYNHPALSAPGPGVIYTGMYFMLEVIQNRLSTEKRFQGKSWFDVVNATYDVQIGNTKTKEYEFQGYPYGQRINQAALGSNGSEPCERARAAIEAISVFNYVGRKTFTNFNYWRGVKQGNWIRPLNGTKLNPTPGAFRVANTDFYHK